MIRLAILGDGNTASEFLSLAPRLRAASVTAISEVRELDRTEFDALVISSREACDEPGRIAADLGIHLFIATAPLAPATDASRLIHVAQTRDLHVMPGWLDRFLPSVRSIKQSLDQGQLGDPGLIRIHRWLSQNRHAADVSADIDLAVWMFQSLPTEIYARGRLGKQDALEYVQVHLGFAAGGMGLIDVSKTLASTDGYYSISLIGSAGAAYADDHHNQQLLFRGQSPISLGTGQGNAGRLAALQEFVDAIIENREPAVTARDANRAMLVCEAVWESIKSGRSARLVEERYEC